MNYKLFIVVFIFPLYLLAQESRNNNEKQYVFTLAEAISYAKKHSYAIQNAEDEITIADKKVRETTAMGLPQINASAEYQNFLKQPVQLIPAEMFGGVLGEFVEVSFGTKHNIKTSATLSQLIFDGSYIVGLQSAKVYKQISEIAKNKTEIAVKQGVVNAYAGVLMVRESIKILNKNKETISQDIEQMVEIVNNGLAEEQSVEQLTLTLNSINTQLETMTNQEEYNLNMLKYVMGISVKDTLELTETLDQLVGSYSINTLTQNEFSYTNHIDYKLSENTTNAQKLMIKFEKSKSLPSLSAYLNYGVSSNSNTFTLFDKDQKWFDSSILGVKLNVPIFSGLARNSRIQQAQINLEKSKRKQQETAEKLNLNYQTAKLDYTNSLAIYQNAKEALALAERIEKKENIKFFEGISGSFDLSHAQSQLYIKQQEYLQSIFNLINKKAALENALGY